MNCKIKWLPWRYKVFAKIKLKMWCGWLAVTMRICPSTSIYTENINVNDLLDFWDTIAMWRLAKSTLNGSGSKLFFEGQALDAGGVGHSLEFVSSSICSVLWSMCLHMFPSWRPSIFRAAPKLQKQNKNHGSCSLNHDFKKAKNERYLL